MLPFNKGVGSGPHILKDQFLSTKIEKLVFYRYSRKAPFYGITKELLLTGFVAYYIESIRVI